uniref:Kinesin-like protein n=1 Tax=Meloidogyne javanica TaxID=6303 RepID=A0A915MBF7_MELJA
MNVKQTTESINDLEGRHWSFDGNINTTNILGQKESSGPKNPELYKTQWCRNILVKGNCSFEDKCWFVHDSSELRNVPQLNKTINVPPLFNLSSSALYNRRIGLNPNIASTSSSTFNSTLSSQQFTTNLLEGTQQHLFKTIGIDVVNNAFCGFNTCVFAYGQTGSGKSYTMMGTKEEPGLIPRLCKELFQRINQNSSNIKVEISFYEVYNERIRDLLSNSKPLKVREHSLLGPIVEGLSIFQVTNVEQIERVFSIKITQIVVAVEDKNFTGETVSKISLVDLAGSERVQKTGAIGKRLEEGSNINKSLTALGKVIAALASNKNNGSTTQPKRGTNNKYFVPYRDSVLTWLLKENLGGNSRTTMIATISPSSEHYEETLSTLRFADRAKRIQTNAVVNEDPNAKIIRELREEVERLKILNQTTQEKQQEVLQEAMAQIAEQHNKEKQLALEKQYEEFAEYIRDLLTNTQSSPYPSIATTPSGPFNEVANGSFQQFSIEEINVRLKLEEMREAISTVSLNSNLTIINDGLNKWDEMEELEYTCNKRSSILQKQSLVGVANVYLGALLHNLTSPLQTQVLIINQQGEISGKLSVQIHKTVLLSTSESSESMEFSDKEEAEDVILEELNHETERQLLGQSIVAKVEILKATNLPVNQSHLVFCQYSFFDQPQLIIPSITNVDDTQNSSDTTNSSDEFELVCTQTFLDYIQEDALSIEVWGHKQPLDDEEEIEERQQKENNYLNNFVEQKMQILQERWKEVTKRLELFCEILELNDVGEYIPVNVDTENNCGSGGIYRLRPGQQRRLCLTISSLEENGGYLPLHLEDICSVSIGSIILIEEGKEENEENNSKKLLDSYQENDLIKIGNLWNNLLLKREKYLKKELKSLNNFEEKERENSLFLSWIELIEERNALSLPTKEGIPGALIELINVEGFEKYCPIIFLDRKEENEINLNVECEDENMSVIGEDCFLMGENNEDDNLELTRLSVICPWDSSLHECSAMNRESKIGEYIYVIVKTYIKISQPISACVVLRKRLCLQFISFEQRSQNLLTTTRWHSRFFSSWPLSKNELNQNEEEIIKKEEKRIGTGLFVDIIGCIPKCTLEMEKRMESQQPIKLNKYLTEYLSKTIQNVECQNEGFNFVDSPGSPNSSGYASLASSSAERCNLRLTGIEEEENQMNVSAAGDYFNNN